MMALPPCNALRTEVVTVIRFRHFCAADAETGHLAVSAAPSSSTRQIRW